MKSFLQSHQDSAIVMGLFAVAAVLMIAVVVFAQLGMTGAAEVLNQVAGPVCAAAVAVLVHRAFQKPQSDPDA